MPELSTHAKGLAITAAGVTVLSSDALLIRLISADAWTIVFWRGVLVAVSFSVLLAVSRGRGIGAAFRAVGWRGLLAAVLLGLSMAMFVGSIAMTAVANTLVIVAAIPLFAALFARLFLREAVALRTWIAILAAICGIVLLVSGSLRYGGLPGDLMAIGVAVLMGGYFTALRYARHLDMRPALALSGLVAAGVAAWPAAPLTLEADDVLYVALLGLVVLPTASGLISLGPRYLPAAEVSLLMLLETVFGPLWVWLLLGETPTTEAFAGGAVVIAALVWHSAAGLRRTRAAPVA